ncbi:uncharacterized protein MKK02DRAFT_43960 [Dioszegia hungarica]|uniref:Uncharacterized protein n=1 Tax=Dioszegia hungarica TaxID=4972 RepID=A0AA38LU68_9TREE|nr:uncharacterized protein MKK02DRAFT_43960 [Dioszegia hungarica]KAI9635278.1 hypothetical protein MKK02DRAFT_43960 [Dioszegia hungarica]
MAPIPRTTGMQVQAPSWEDQIVPTLKKRLETESQYLTNRLSSSGYTDQYEQNEIPPTPLSASFGPDPTSTASGASNIPIRTRTKSTPFFDAPHDASSSSTSPTPYDPRNRPDYAAGPSRIPIPSRAARRPSYNDYDTTSDSSSPSSRIPRLQPSAQPRRPSGSSSISSTSVTRPSSPGMTANRTISRPRSKSQLAPRPAVIRRPSGGSQGGGSEGNREVLSHRDSFDLSKQTFPDTYLRDELPPFRLPPEEAMRIAQHGHKMDAESGWGGEDGREEGLDEDGSSKRKRIESMFPAKDPRRGSQGKGGTGQGSAGGMSRSATGTGSALGLGQAPSRIATGSKLNSSQRSATGSGFANRSGLSSSQTSTGGRSMSLGHSLNVRETSPMPTPPRMGVAAHFVPPESAYTPPKGANWDDVVLPALARKMGLGQEGERRIGVDEMEEGDLAVEWDKTGTPVKWVKRPDRASPHPSSAPSSKLGSGGRIGRGLLTEDESNLNIPRSASAFSPTFEPSPDNPLQPPSSRRDFSTSSDSQTSLPTPTPSPSRYQQQPKPIRTTNAHDAAYDTGPPSPAPFPSLQRRPSTGPYALRPPGSGSGIELGEPVSGSEGEGRTRKLSILRRKPSTASRQPSNADLRIRASNNSLRQGGPLRPGGGGVQAQGLSRPSDVAWERERQAAAGNQRVQAAGDGVAGGGSVGTGQGLRKEEGSHGKGCGCVIM